MPTVHREGPYRFFFYSNERAEPAHVHIESGEGTAKFWLTPDVREADSHGYNRSELTQIAKLIAEHIDEFREAWNAHHQSAAGRESG